MKRTYFAANEQKRTNKRQSNQRTSKLNITTDVSEKRRFTPKRKSHELSFSLSDIRSSRQSPRKKTKNSALARNNDFLHTQRKVSLGQREQVRVHLPVTFSSDRRQYRPTASAASTHPQDSREQRQSAGYTPSHSITRGRGRGSSYQKQGGKGNSFRAGSPHVSKRRTHKAPCYSEKKGQLENIQSYVHTAAEGSKDVSVRERTLFPSIDKRVYPRYIASGADEAVNPAAVPPYNESGEDARADRHWRSQTGQTEFENQPTEYKRDRLISHSAAVEFAPPVTHTHSHSEHRYDGYRPSVTAESTPPHINSAHSAARTYSHSNYSAVQDRYPCNGQRSSSPSFNNTRDPHSRCSSPPLDTSRSPPLIPEDAFKLFGCRKYSFKKNQSNLILEDILCNEGSLPLRKLMFRASGIQFHIPFLKDESNAEEVRNTIHRGFAACAFVYCLNMAVSLTNNMNGEEFDHWTNMLLYASEPPTDASPEATHPKDLPPLAKIVIDDNTLDESAKMQINVPRLVFSLSCLLMSSFCLSFVGAPFDEHSLSLRILEKSAKRLFVQIWTKQRAFQANGQGDRIFVSQTLRSEESLKHFSTIQSCSFPNNLSSAMMACLSLKHLATRSFFGITEDVKDSIRFLVVKQLLPCLDLRYKSNTEQSNRDACNLASSTPSSSPSSAIQNIFSAEELTAAREEVKTILCTSLAYMSRIPQSGSTTLSDSELSRKYLDTSSYWSTSSDLDALKMCGENYTSFPLDMFYIFVLNGEKCDSCARKVDSLESDRRHFNSVTATPIATFASTGDVFVRLCYDRQGHEDVLCDQKCEFSKAYTLFVDLCLMRSVSRCTEPLVDKITNHVFGDSELSEQVPIVLQCFSVYSWKKLAKKMEKSSLLQRFAGVVDKAATEHRVKAPCAVWKFGSHDKTVKLENGICINSSVTAISLSMVSMVTIAALKDPSLSLRDYTVVWSEDGEIFVLVWSLKVVCAVEEICKNASSAVGHRTFWKKNKNAGKEVKTPEASIPHIPCSAFDCILASPSNVRAHDLTFLFVSKQIRELSNLGFGDRFCYTGCTLFKEKFTRTFNTVLYHDPQCIDQAIAAVNNALTHVKANSVSVIGNETQVSLLHTSMLQTYLFVYTHAEKNEAVGIYISPIVIKLLRNCKDDTDAIDLVNINTDTSSDNELYYEFTFFENGQSFNAKTILKLYNFLFSLIETDPSHMYYLYGIQNTSIPHEIVDYFMEEQTQLDIVNTHTSTVSVFGDIVKSDKCNATCVDIHAEFFKPGSPLYKEYCHQAAVKIEPRVVSCTSTSQWGMKNNSKCLFPLVASRAVDLLNTKDSKLSSVHESVLGNGRPFFDSSDSFAVSLLCAHPRVRPVSYKSSFMQNYLVQKPKKIGSQWKFSRT